jgi:S-adenosylmethionine-dependent methyltransferase
VLSARNLSPELKARIKRIIAPKTPAGLAANFRSPEKGFKEIDASLKRNYYWKVSERDMDAFMASPEGREDFLDHQHRRLDTFRATVIPWLADTRPLAGKRILEIGCGTGSSTVALAEQGADVLAVDIDDHSLAVAQDRCAAYGIEASFLNVNATELSEHLVGQRFDFIIFFASLEHMIHEERIEAMRDTWAMLSKGDLWCVVETPNRLWYFDSHTSRLPFYSWLPTDLAFAYSRYSPRAPFKDTYRDRTAEKMMTFLREGHGVSFHEFELAMKPAKDLDVVSSLGPWLRKNSLFRLWDHAWRFTTDHRFEKCLMEVAPEVPAAFCQPYLDIVIRKD